MRLPNSIITFSSQRAALAGDELSVDEIFTGIEPVEETPDLVTDEVDIDNGYDEVDLESDTNEVSAIPELSTLDVDIATEDDILDAMPKVGDLPPIESPEDLNEEEPPLVEKKSRARKRFNEDLPPITSLTILARAMRNDGFKLSMFNIKDTLVRFLDMFGERKVARHIIDYDSSSFYEIHALYVPGATIYQFLTALGFVPMHPTDLDDEEYSRDMPYEVAMKNETLTINVLGGLQQHSPMEETIIRNLYEWEKKRFSVFATPPTSTSNATETTKNLVLAAMQSYSLQQEDIALEFFTQAMQSSGVDTFINTLAHTELLEEL